MQILLGRSFLQDVEDFRQLHIFHIWGSAATPGDGEFGGVSQLHFAASCERSNVRIRDRQGAA